jgi:hypothetical protein
MRSGGPFPALPARHRSVRMHARPVPLTELAAAVVVDQGPATAAMTMTMVWVGIGVLALSAVAFWLMAERF